MPTPQCGKPEAPPRPAGRASAEAQLAQLNKNLCRGRRSERAANGPTQMRGKQLVTVNETYMCARDFGNLASNCGWAT
eukprot:1163854-Alexandrium_andersonii.AAC.1